MDLNDLDDLDLNDSNNIIKKANFESSKHSGNIQNGNTIGSNMKDGKKQSRKMRSYDRSNQRILVDSNILRKILDEIKKKEPNIFSSDNKISEYIGTNVNNALSGYSMNKISFKKLQELYGKPISYKIKEPWQMKVSLEKSEDLAEMFGISLGDGHLNKIDNRLEIALNGIDDWEYVKYVKRLMEFLFKKSPKIDWLRDRKSASGDEKGVVLIISSIELVEELELLGLVSGNKCYNQVGVPDWLKESRTYIIKCLKGLMDTDGWIGVNKIDKSINIKFSSCSKPLVKSFIDLCKMLDIMTSNLLGPYKVIDLRSGIISERYLVKISSKNEVKKFITIITPEKWKLRLNYIGTILIYLSDDIKSKTIEKEIKNAYPNGQIQYSKKFEEFLVNLCKKYGYLINDYTIKESIINAFVYKRTQYNRDYAEYLKKLFEELGSTTKIIDYLKQEGIASPIPTEKTIRGYIWRLFEENDYKLKYGANLYNEWLSYNYPIFVSEKKIGKFSLSATKVLCRWIYQIIIKDYFSPDSEIIQKLIFLINNVEINDVINIQKTGEIIIDDEIDDSLRELKILKFERLSFLLNNQELSNSIYKYLKLLINFIKEMIELSKSHFNISLDEIRRYLRNKLNIFWKNEPLMDILQFLPYKLFSFL